MPRYPWAPPPSDVGTEEAFSLSAERKALRVSNVGMPSILGVVDTGNDAMNSSGVSTFDMMIK